MYGGDAAMDSCRAWRRLEGARSLRAEERRAENALSSRRRRSAREDSSDRTFPPHRRIRARADFLRLQRGSRGAKTPHFVVIAERGPGPDRRLGVTVSRKIGDAVRRNRVKRLVREFFRKNRSELQPALDLLVIARAGAETLSFKDVESELARALGIRR
jgi:ribonuclease P protein component